MELSHFVHDNIMQQNIKQQNVLQNADHARLADLNEVQQSYFLHLFYRLNNVN